MVGAGGLPKANPEKLSVQVKLTVIFVLFQPFAFGAGARAAVMFGGVLSILTVRVFADSRLPASSVAKKVIILIPSVEIVSEAELPVIAVLATV